MISKYIETVIKKLPTNNVILDSSDFIFVAHNK